MKYIKNKKNIIIISILVVLIILAILIFINSKPKKINRILKNNDYELKDEIPSGTIVEDYEFQRNTYRYEKNGIVLMVYEYSSLKEIKDEVLAGYEQEKNSSFEIELEDEENYIYKKSCDNSICIYNLGYEAELVSTVVNMEQVKETDEIFKEIKKDKKL